MTECSRKKGGEFYTPAQVSRLLAQIVTEGKARLKSVYDPTCGSGSLLLRIGDYTNVNMYLGQELNPTTYNLARMNMILHGVRFDHFSIRQGDTLTDDMHADLQAEAVVANPPFSAEWKSDSDPFLASDERFSQYGRLAPKSAAPRCPRGVVMIAWGCHVLAPSSMAPGTLGRSPAVLVLRSQGAGLVVNGGWSCGHTVPSGGSVPSMK